MKLSSSFGAHQSLTHSHRPLTQHKPGERRADREETDSSNIHKYHIWKQTARKCQAAPRVTDESPARLAQKRAPVQHVLLNFVWIHGVLLLIGSSQLWSLRQWGVKPWEQHSKQPSRWNLTIPSLLSPLIRKRKTSRLNECNVISWRCLQWSEERRQGENS